MAENKPCQEEEANEMKMNESKIYCERCQSVILLANKAAFCNTKFFLPHMKKKTDGTSTEGEDVDAVWKVDDMFTFENVGFSNTVNNIKYLTCADCEIGPIGWHDINDKKAFYIASNRVLMGE